MYQMRQTSLTLQQRLSQLIGAKLTTLINPFGLVEEQTILRVLRSTITVSGGLVLSPSGLQLMSINRKAQNHTTRRFSIALNSIARDGQPNSPIILKNRRVVQIGTDFLETTVNGNSIQLIPLSNVSVIFGPQSSSQRNKRDNKR
ncbi:hypothetical protein [Paenibacillus sp. LjRoot153]|uniref:hypothetical protein n=1 Tax=Paenibacillus sp. LjRoot153 TaxID=3342270 RepID=UPI003F507BFF